MNLQKINKTTNIPSRGLNSIKMTNPICVIGGEIDGFQFKMLIITQQYIGLANDLGQTCEIAR